MTEYSQKVQTVNEENKCIFCDNEMRQLKGDIRKFSKKTFSSVKQYIANYKAG